MFLFFSGTLYSAQKGPETVVKEFYDKILGISKSGLPDEKELVMILPFFMAEYKTLFEEAKKIQLEIKKNHPDEKPPWIEGNIFSSLFEGPDHYSIKKIKIKNEEARVSLELENRQSGEIIRWTDVILLKNVGSQWLISDILFKGSFEFKTGQSLSEVLKSRD